MNVPIVVGSTILKKIKVVQKGIVELHHEQKILKMNANKKELDKMEKAFIFQQHENHENQQISKSAESENVVYIDEAVLENKRKIWARILRQKDLLQKFWLGSSLISSYKNYEYFLQFVKNFVVLKK